MTNALPILVNVILIFALMILVPLSIFHTFLVVTNWTTSELLSRRTKIPYLAQYPEGVNPFDKGCVENVRAFCLAEMDATLPSLDEIRERERIETLCNNRFYSCCG